MKTPALLRATPENLAAAGVDEEIHFGEGLTIVGYRMPRGTFITKHVHQHSHMSILAKGHVKVTTDKSTFWVSGRGCINIPAGMEHRIEAIEDSYWYCIHPVDADKVDGFTR